MGEKLAIAAIVEPYLLVNHKRVISMLKHYQLLFITFQIHMATNVNCDTRYTCHKNRGCAVISQLDFFR